MEKIDYIIVLLLILLVVSSVLIVKNIIGIKQEPDTIEDIIVDCINLDLIKTSECLRDNIGTFYNYSITDDNIELSFKELKEFGGDCKDYSEIYNTLALRLDFDSKQVIIKNGVYYHIFTVISDGTGYCILDQLSMGCSIWMLKKP